MTTLQILIEALETIADEERVQNIDVARAIAILALKQTQQKAAS